MNIDKKISKYLNEATESIWKVWKEMKQMNIESKIDKYLSEATNVVTVDIDVDDLKKFERSLKSANFKYSLDYKNSSVKITGPEDSLKSFLKKNYDSSMTDADFKVFLV